MDGILRSGSVPVGGLTAIGIGHLLPDAASNAAAAPEAIQHRIENISFHYVLPAADLHRLFIKGNGKGNSEKSVQGRVGMPGCGAGGEVHGDMV